MRHFDATEVRQMLSYDACIDVIRKAMVDHSAGRTRHLLRTFIDMGTAMNDRRTFAQMPAALAVDGWFGAKLVSVFADPANPSHRAHRGLVVLFEGKTGEPVCTADAGAVTELRTAAASAVATDALANPDAAVLAILGTGSQAEPHVAALALVRPLKRILVWGRSRKRAEEFARRVSASTGLAIEVAPTAQAAVAGADIVCTVTSAAEPVLLGKWLKEGAHVNLVGSSAPGPVEVDSALVVNSRFIADCREHVVNHGAEFLRAKAAGLVGDEHIVAEIGEVLAGSKEGRRSREETTVYKSLGHAIQDLATVAHLYERASSG